MSEPLRVGIGGPVGAGKTTLVEQLCRKLSNEYEVAVVTNDIYTQEDAEILWRAQALPEDRIVGVETGGCPHTAIREDASMNLAAIDALNLRFPELEIVIVESGGDNLSAPLVLNLLTLRSMSLTSPLARRSQGKGARVLLEATCLLSTKLILHLT